MELFLTHQHVLENGTLTGGEPDLDALQRLKNGGYTHLISMRGVGESANGASYFEAHGFTFRHLPISGPNDFNDQFLNDFNEALEATPHGKTVVFCATGNRVGAAFALHGAQYQGMTATEAIHYGQTAGLTRLEPFVRQRLGPMD